VINQLYVSYIERDAWLGVNYSVRMIHSRFTDKRQLDIHGSGGDNTSTTGTIAQDNSQCSRILKYSDTSQRKTKRNTETY
jgi:hypothetical protein